MNSHRTNDPVRRAMDIAEREAELAYREQALSGFGVCNWPEDVVNLYDGIIQEFIVHE